jgi:hypothetical protein
MRGIVAMLMLVLAHISVWAQSNEDIETILEVLGVMNIEEADGEEVERLYGIIRHPLKLNLSGSQRLESSGLFTPYQIASLADYRARHGDILSFTELSAVDGFTSRSVNVLRRFISLESSSDGIHRKRSAQHIRGDLDVKTSLRQSTSLKTAEKPLEWKYSARGRIQHNDALALSASYSDGSVYSGNLTYAHRLGKVIVGDFNTRFGQGLCLWNTAVIGSMTSPSAFMRKASGLSPSFSFTGNYAMTGVAADMAVGKWKLTALADVPNVKKASLNSLHPAANITRYFRFGHASMTHSMVFDNLQTSYFTIPQMRSSVDASLCFRGVNAFGEAMCDWVERTLSAIGGVQGSAGEYSEYAALVRCLPATDEHGFAVSWQVQKLSHLCVVTTDLLCYPHGKGGSSNPISPIKDGATSVQLKMQARWRWDITDVVHSEVRMTERVRTWGEMCRTDVRVDVGAHPGLWNLCGRLNLLNCVSWGLLGYVEAGYGNTDRLKFYLRQGVFRIDDWDDRIYVYERDGPGNFTVPAFYGRGVWTSLYAKWRFARWGSAYVRASYTSYPWMKEKKKPGRAELKFQLALHF